MFFTDLDRTIIFSHRFVTNKEDPFLVPVEVKDGREISYMRLSSYMLLKILRCDSLFVPVTARKYDEIMRISFVKEKFPTWMICESGRVIYHEGKRYAEWDKKMEKAKKGTLSNLQKAQQKFREILETKNGCMVWHVNEEIIMARTVEVPKNVYEELKVWEKWFLEHDCQLHLQQRKAYLLPTFISKEKAVTFLIDKLKPTVTVSAGDAEMDSGMFGVTDFAVAPKHHTISKVSIPVTKETGLQAGEEILSYAISKLYNS